MKIDQIHCQEVRDFESEIRRQLNVARANRDLSQGTKLSRGSIPEVENPEKKVEELEQVLNTLEYLKTLWFPEKKRRSKK